MVELAVFLFSVAVLGSQVAWTRIFSFTIWYHFAFLVISVAMLGFTAGGLWNVRSGSLERRPADVLGRAALGFALATVLGLAAVVNLPFEGGILESGWNLAWFAVLMLLVAAPFAFAGLFVCFAISSRPDRVSRIYFANMTGSGAGCALSVYLLDRMMPTAALIALAVLAAISALPLVAGSRSPRWATRITLACVVVLGATWWLASIPMTEPFFLESTKSFPRLEKRHILSRNSNSLGVVDLFRHEIFRIGMWGLSLDAYERDYPGRGVPPAIGYCIDSWALTYAYGGPTEITEEPIFDYVPASLVYTVSDPEDVLIVGAGGGEDVVNALRNGVESITAVEINPYIVDLGRRQLADFNQGIFHRPGVTLVEAEGRSFLMQSRDRLWDVIQISGVDTLAASQAGAFTLTENYLYTVEAFDAYLQHLEPGGILTMTRWIYDPPRQTLRVIVLADAALRRAGAADPSRHMILISDERFHFSVFLISREPFSEEVVRRVAEVAADRDWVPLYLPGADIGLERSNPYQELARAQDKQAFIDTYPYDISLTTDDDPFFMEHSRWSRAWEYRDYIFQRSNGHLLLLVTTILVGLFGAVFLLVPARALGAVGRSHARRWKVLAFFSCLGLAYVLIEIVLVQKLTLFLGNPSYALAVVLCALLVFSGLGAMISGRLPGRPTRVLVLCCLTIAAVIVSYRFGMDLILDRTLHLPLTGRIALVLGLLSFPALVMGMPFPTAVRALGERDQDAVVAGWVANGYFSVLASCLAMVLSISFGFGVVILIGAAAYVLAALIRPLEP
jgi:hypothetical protein